MERPEVDTTFADWLRQRMPGLVPDLKNPLIRLAWEAYLAGWAQKDCDAPHPV